MDNCQGANKIHFIGIGGIGVSALARYFLAQGAEVSGSDLSPSEITDDLKKLGVKISTPCQNGFGTGQVGHNKKNLPADADLVIYSAAVGNDNPELKEAKARGIKCRTYAQALGELTKQYFTIAVSGSHGKSTTTAMLANILVKAGFDPTVIIGTKLKEFGDSNFRAGKSKYLLIEADEWNGSFLNYRPKMIVLTNIDREHLDYYENLNHIIKTFREYVGHLPDNGILAANQNDHNITRMLTRFKVQDLRFKIIRYGKSILKSEFLNLKSLLKVPGEHNVYNALAALSAARALKIPDKISFKALSEYRGAWRRFEWLGKFNGADIISDYAHHPTEIRATLQAAREKYLYPVRNRRFSNGVKKEIWCVFQPHQLQRTEFLFRDFVSAFDAADKIFLLDIYGVPGREKEGSKVSSEKLAMAIKKRGKNAVYFSDFGTMVKALKKSADKNKTILIMGAGDIWKVGKSLTI
jgi:UDP-N-acetylmuramate--alanine ligase